MISHLTRLGLEQSLLLDEVDEVAHQVTQNGIEHHGTVLVIPTDKGIIASCANVGINKSELP